MVVAKPAEIRQEQKKFFNIAYQGEPVVVSRPRSENVVIISEDEYNDIMAKNRLLSYYLGLADNNASDHEGIDIDNNVGKGQKLKVGIAKGIELCNPDFDFDAYDEDIANMFGVL